MHREFVELSKELYVEVARDEYGIRGRPTNVARMALLTGMDRKEVTRVKGRLEERGGEAAPRDPQQGQDRIARVLSGWHQDREFVDGDGKPLVLPLEGAAPSFAALVRRYGGDVPATTILGELKRTGTAEVADGAMRVLRRNYRLDTVDATALARAGSVLRDVGHTVTHNLYRGPRQDSRFEARATNVQIPPWALPAYRKFIYAEGQAFLEKVDAWLTDAEIDENEAAGNGAQRVGVGLAFLRKRPQHRDGAGLRRQARGLERESSQLVEGLRGAQASAADVLEELTKSRRIHPRPTRRPAWRTSAIRRGLAPDSRTYSTVSPLTTNCQAVTCSSAKPRTRLAPPGARATPNMAQKSG